MANGLLSGVQKWWDTPTTYGSPLTRFGLELMARSSGQPRPVGLGQAVGGAGIGTLDYIQKQRQAEMKKKYMQLQMKEMERKAAAAEAEAKRAQRLRDYYSPQSRALRTGGGPTPAAARALTGFQGQPDPRQFMSAKGLEDLYKTEISPYTLSPGAARYKGAERIVAQPAKPPGPQWKKVPDAASLTGASWKNLADPTVPTIPAPQTGMTIVSDGKGGFTIQTGGGGVAQKPTLKDLEGKVLAGQTQLSNIARMTKAYQDVGPEALTWMGKYKDWMREIQEKSKGVPGAETVLGWAGFTGTPEQKRQLAKFARFRRVVSSNMNAYIKAVTGAQMSEPEAKRLSNDMPNLDDAPTQFLSKLRDFRKTAVHAQARYRYALKKGVVGPETKNVGNALEDKLGPVDSFPALYDRVAEEIERNLRKRHPGIPEEELRMRRDIILDREFGRIEI